MNDMLSFQTILDRSWTISDGVETYCSLLWKAMFDFFLEFDVICLLRLFRYRQKSRKWNIRADQCDLTCVFDVESHCVLKIDAAILRHADEIFLGSRARTLMFTKHDSYIFAMRDAWR